MNRAPEFSWEAFNQALEENPDFDVFAKFSFSKLSKSEKAAVAQQILDRAMNRAKLKNEATQ